MIALLEDYRRNPLLRIASEDMDPVNVIDADSCFHDFGDRPFKI